MNKFFLIILLCFKLQAQIESNSSNRYKLLALTTLLSEGLNTGKNVVNEKSFFTFYRETDLLMTKIENENFEGISFFHVEEQPRTTSKTITYSLPLIWDLNDCGGYIIAILEGNNYVYKLKGFKVNEFYNFYRSLKNYKFPYTKSKKAFIKNYKVEGLDFECLFNSLKIKHSEKDLENYPCVSDTCLKFFKTPSY